MKKVHLFAIKRFLRLSNRTSVIGYGESGRYPPAVSFQIRSIKYWLRLLKLGRTDVLRIWWKGAWYLGWKNERAATKAMLQ